MPPPPRPGLRRAPQDAEEEADTVAPVFESARTDGGYVIVTFSEEITVSPQASSSTPPGMPVRNDARTYSRPDRAPAFELSTEDIRIAEGESGTYTVSLVSQPSEGLTTAASGGIRTGKAACPPSRPRS